MGAGKQISVGHDHVRKAGCIFSYFRDVNYAPDVDASMADKDPYARLLSEYVFLHRIALSLCLNQGVSGRS